MPTSTEKNAWQQAVIRELGVTPDFDVAKEREQRITLPCDYLALQGLRTYVLGISGGVDSSTAGRLAQHIYPAVRSPWCTVRSRSASPWRR
jgi:NAD+ synthase